MIFYSVGSAIEAIAATANLRAVRLAGNFLPGNNIQRCCTRNMDHAYFQRAQIEKFVVFGSP